MHAKVFSVTRCSQCSGQLDLPSVHFMCNHSYHQRYVLIFFFPRNHTYSSRDVSANVHFIQVPAGPRDRMPALRTPTWGHPGDSEE